LADSLLPRPAPPPGRITSSSSRRLLARSLTGAGVRGHAGRYGETVDLLVEDLLAWPSDRVVIVDYFGVLPRDLAPLLSWPGQAVFLVPAPDFRRSALTRRYSDPERARANWGDLDLAEVLKTRLARDALWDEEVTLQADALGLPRFTIDGDRPPMALLDDLTRSFGLVPRQLD
jgi:hypothetical protein